MNGFLGIPAATLAAVSGGTGLAADTATNVPAFLALFAAGFGAALTTLNPSRRVTQSQVAANAYLSLQTDIRQLLTIDLLTLPERKAREALASLTARRDEINGTADPPGWYASRRARKSIEAGGQMYEVDKEKQQWRAP
jgi:hypothetical protein